MPHMRLGVACLILASVSVASASIVDIGKLMPLGDSITEGTGTPQLGGYRGPLYASLRTDGFTFTPVGPRTQGGLGLSLQDRPHAGQPAWNVASLTFGQAAFPDRGNVSQWMAAHAPDVVLLMAGTNDSAEYKNNPMGMRSRYNELLDAIFAVDPSVQVHMASIPKANSSFGANYLHHLAHATNISQMVPEIVAERQLAGRSIFYVDMFTALDPATDLADFVHPNAQGYAKIATKWEQSLQAVPEPTSLLGASGLMALLLRSKLRRAQS
jgi:lysophospholipase L1-like esterase